MEQFNQVHCSQATDTSQMKNEGYFNALSRGNLKLFIYGRCYDYYDDIKHIY